MYPKRCTSVSIVKKSRCLIALQWCRGKCIPNQILGFHFRFPHSKISLFFFICWVAFTFSVSHSRSFTFSVFHILGLLLPAESLSCLYIQWFAHMDAICKEGLSRKCVFAPNFLVNRGKIKGYETFTVYFVRKNRFPNKSIQPLSIGDVKILLPTWKVGKASIYKLVVFFFVCLFTWSTKFPPFFQRWSMVRGQSSPCLLRFSAQNKRLFITHILCFPIKVFFNGKKEKTWDWVISSIQDFAFSKEGTLGFYKIWLSSCCLYKRAL